MSLTSINTEAKFLLDGVQLNAPLKWDDIIISAHYENDAVQPSLSIENFTFTLEAREKIKEWIANGINNGVGIFEGMPFQVTLYNNTTVQENFKAFIDFTNGYKDLQEDGTNEASIIKDQSLDQFIDQLESTTYGYLEEISAIGSAQYTPVNYVVEKKFNMIEILISSVILYLMIKELAEAVDRLIDAIINTIGHLTGGIYGSIGAAIYAIAKAIIILLYVAILLAAVIELGNKLIEALLPKVREHLTVNMFTALETVCSHFGYAFVSPIPELLDVYYLPSNPNNDDKTAKGFISVTKGTQSGIPFTSDYGYRCSEMFQLARDLFNAKLIIVNNTVHLRSENDPYWIQQSTWSLPSVLLNSLEYNTDEMRAEILLTFITDLNDDWTIDKYFGTAYEVKTEAVSTLRKRAVLLKGLDEVNFGTALGTRKDELNGIEKFLKDVAGFVDKLTSFFGGGTSLQDKIKARLGVLKVANNWHSVPKLLYLKGGKLPENHRDLWNAKVLWDKYHVEKSFVSNNWKGQKVYYKGVTIPFGFDDYQQLTTNSYFKFKGKDAKIMDFDWKFGQDTAEIDFWVRQEYTHNLKETFINPT